MLLLRPLALPLSKLFVRKGLIRHFAPLSSSATESVGLKTNDGLAGEEELVLIYEGQFWKKLRWLRRVSISSSILSLIGMPLLLYMNKKNVVMMGQVAIGGTALISTLSSTVFLQTVTHPYVTSLYEVKRSNVFESIDAPIASTPRKFRALRLDLLGRSVVTDFVLSDAKKVTDASSHPFSSVKIKNQYFYIFGKAIEDKVVREALTKE